MGHPCNRKQEKTPKNWIMMKEREELLSKIIIITVYV